MPLCPCTLSCFFWRSEVSSLASCQRGSSPGEKNTGYSFDHLIFWSSCSETVYRSRYYPPDATFARAYSLQRLPGLVKRPASPPMAAPRGRLLQFADPCRRSEKPCVYGSCQCMWISRCHTPMQAPSLVVASVPNEKTSHLLPPRMQIEELVVLLPSRPSTLCCAAR